MDAQRTDRPELRGQAPTGNYAIQRELGRGGMATVYLAHDSKHDRQVVVKVLNAELAALLGPERFLREIRIAAKLQHPHILGLIDSGVFGPDAGELAGRPYYVMPYVRDGSLRARLEREGQLPVADAVRIAQEVAGALDYAHRQGVIHRDVKPENILLQDGAALVADFGIALAVEQAGGARLTQSGVTLGTPQYMAPEQAAGERTITGRADQYALASVTYEMLAGEPPFTGPTAQAVAARVLTDTARPLVASRSTVPPHIDAAIFHALEKVPADRFETPRNFAEALSVPGGARSFAGAGSEAIGSTREVRPRSSHVLVIGLAIAAVLATGVAAWLALRDRPVPPQPIVRFALTGLAAQAAGNTPAITPDGGTIIYSRPGGGLVARSLGALGARPIAGTELATHPFVSPDGRWVGFFTQDDRLGKVRVDGGAPAVFLGTMTRFSRGSWADAGVIIVDHPRGGLSVFDTMPGSPRALTRLDSARGESRHLSPLSLTGGKSVVFVVIRGAEEAAPTTELAVVPLDRRATGPTRHTPLGVAGSFPVGLIDGWLVYGAPDRSGLLAAPFDASARKVTGQPVEVLHDVEGGLEGATIASDGTLIYTHRMASGDLVLVDAHGITKPLITGADLGGRGYMNPRLSPDGKRIAVIGRSASGATNVWLYDLASGAKTRLAMGSERLDLEWAPDGKRIVFSSGDRGYQWWQSVDGIAPPEQLAAVSGTFAKFTSDGRSLIFERKTGGVFGIWTLRLDGSATPQPLLTGPTAFYMSSVSPNGKWLAYVASESGREEVYVQPYPGPGAAVQVSEKGGNEPVWSPDGRHLFYRTGSALMDAAVTDTSGFVITMRDSLFRDTFVGGMPHANYAVLPDSRHFVMFGTGSDAGPEAIVVVNWLREFRATLAANH